MAFKPQDSQISRMRKGAIPTQIITPKIEIHATTNVIPAMLVPFTVNPFRVNPYLIRERESRLNPFIFKRE